MARASYIYIIRRRDTRTIIRAWTVKHEMVTWVNSSKRMSRKSLELLTEVVRIRDSRIGCETAMPWEDIPCP